MSAVMEVMLKTLATALLACGLAVSSTAQEVEITGIDQAGHITWSNTPTPLYCGIEAKWDLRHTWLPMQDWSLLVTGTVANTAVDIGAMWDQLAAVLPRLTGDGPHGLFFRVVASSSPLGACYATNLIQVVNASTSVLANVEIGLVESWSHNPITNLALQAQGATSPVVAVVQDIPLPSAGTVSNIVTEIGRPVNEGWYVAYEQDGSNRVVESAVVPFGDPEKKVGVTVGSRSVTVTFEWFGFSRTIDY